MRPYPEKYGGAAAKSAPLEEVVCTLAGRQILEGLAYLEAVGLPTVRLYGTASVLCFHCFLD